MNSKARICLLSVREPLLLSAVKRLLAQLREANEALPLDLSKTLILVPTAQASRRLREQLALEAGENGLLAPRVLTPPALWQLGMPEGVASELECLFAWREVLNSTQSRELLGLPEASSSEQGQLRQLAQQLQTLRFELAEGKQQCGTVLDFQGACQILLDKGEEDERWAHLAKLEARFRNLLHSWGRVDPVLAKPQWVKANGALSECTRIVLLGLSDPMPRLLPWLEELSQKGVALESWLAATAEMKSSLDSWGRPLASVWQDKEIPLNEAILSSSATAEEFSQQALKQVATWGIESNELTVGICDGTLAQPLRSEFEAQGWKCFDPQAQQAAICGIMPLFEILRELLQGRVQGLLELASQPQLELLFPALKQVDVTDLSWLAQRWMEALPTHEKGLMHFAKQLEEALEYHLKHQEHSSVSSTQNSQQSLTPSQLSKRERVNEEQVLWLKELLGQIFSWRQQFLTQSTPTQALRDLTNSLLTLDDGARGAWWQQWHQRLTELENLEGQGIHLEPAQALSWLLQSMPTVPSLREGEEIALEFEGWLELGMSTSPYLLLCGMHEQVIPAKPPQGAFLHDGLRDTLGLRSRAWRFAVDALRFTQILAARPSAQILIACVSQLPDGQMRLPSRLLLRPSKQEKGQLAKRASSLFDPKQSNTPASSSPILPAWNRAQMQLNLCLENAKEKSFPWQRGLSASMLGDYLRCPLRFALKHIWGMDRLEWEEHEMSSRTSGNLVHAVAEDFAKEAALRSSQDAKVIEEFLIKRLHLHASLRFGPNPPLPLRLQIRSLERRLAAFASWQAKWAADGWEICHAEYPLGGKNQSWVLEGVPLQGFIDRIDYHPDGRWMIWDYKTRAKALAKHAPKALAGFLDDNLHWKRAQEGEASLAKPLELAGRKTPQFKQWINLQLPLYALQFKELKQTIHVDLGQIVIGAQESQVGGYLWSAWSGEQASSVQESALHWAKSAIAAIKAGQFWPPAKQNPSWDIYAKLAPDGWEQALSPASLSLLGYEQAKQSNQGQNQDKSQVEQGGV